MKKLFWAFLIVIALVCTATLASCDTDESPSEPTGTAGGGGADAEYSFSSSELEKYVIVYGGGTNHYRLALNLQQHIYSKYGKRLSVSRDVISDPAEYEILLGDTNRRASQGRIMEFSLEIDEGSCIINAGGAFSVEEAVKYLCEEIFDGREFALGAGEYCKKSFLEKSSQITEDSTVRVMSANLLADSFSDSSYKSAEYRAEIFAGMLISYTPDVLGLQETDAAWGDALDEYLIKLQENYGITYSRLLATYNDKVNYTSLLYRSDKLKVDESGLRDFSWWKDEAFNHSYHMRNISWAQFSTLDDTGKSFIVANTHWSYRTEHANGNTYLSGKDRPIGENELRIQCKDETNEFLSELRQSHSQMPIFLTGDFNTSLPFFTSSGWTPSDFRVISEEAKDNRTALSTVPESNHFDHIFGAGEYSVKLYEFFRDTNCHGLLTDHPFVYADVDF